MREVTPELPFGAGPAPSGLKPKPKTKVSGPGVSKARYRWQRGWNEKLRKIAIVYLPIAILLLGAWRIAAEDSWRLAIEAEVTAFRDSLLASPELAVRRVDVTGATAETRAEVSIRLSDLVGSSSMRLEVKELREQIEALGPIRQAAVQLGPDGVLAVQLTERRPAILWRDTDGVLQLLDAEGVTIGPAEARADYPRMMVLLGSDAPAHVAEAIDIIEAAPILRPRIRALVRVGNRRWNVVLNREQRILLPEEHAARALARIMGLHQGEDELLDRDLSVIDMRIADRPVLRMRERAVEERERLQLNNRGEGEET